MPSEQEASDFLWICLKHSQLSVDWKKVGNEMNLKPGTANMRLTRLRAAVNRGDSVPGDSKRFLWACITTDTECTVAAIDFNKVAAELKLKKGTATMRMTRLRTAMKAELNNPPANPPNASPVKAAPVTPSKRSAKPAAATAKSTPAKKTKVNPKATPVKKEADESEETDSDAALDAPEGKRAYSTPSRTAKRKVSYADSNPSSEPSGSDSDTFAPEREKAKKMNAALRDASSPANASPGLAVRSKTPQHTPGPFATETPVKSDSNGDAAHKSIFGDGVSGQEQIDTRADLDALFGLSAEESAFLAQPLQIEDDEDEWAV